MVLQPMWLSLLVLSRYLNQVVRHSDIGCKERHCPVPTIRTWSMQVQTIRGRLAGDGTSEGEKKNVILSKPQLSGYSRSYFPAFLPYDQCDIPILSHHPILTSIVGCSRVTYVAPRVTVQMYCSPKLNFRRMATRYVCSATIDHLICVRLRQGGLSIPNICSRTTTRCFLLLCYSTGQILF